MANSAESSQKHLFRFGQFELDPLSRELRTNGRIISLQEQSFQILAVLLEHPGQLVTRDELTKKLWPPGTFVDFGHSLNTAVNRLGEGLGDSGERPRFTEPSPRRGYRFIAPVSNHTADERGAISEASLLSERGPEWPAERRQNGSVAGPVARRAAVRAAPHVLTP